jgi:hypothetical protein
VRAGCLEGEPASKSWRWHGDSAELFCNLNLGCFFNPTKNFSRPGTFPTYKKRPFPSYAIVSIHASKPVKYLVTKYAKLV